MSFRVGSPFCFCFGGRTSGHRPYWGRAPRRRQDAKYSSIIDSSNSIVDWQHRKVCFIQLHSNQSAGKAAVHSVWVASCIVHCRSHRCCIHSHDHISFFRQWFLKSNCRYGRSLWMQCLRMPSCRSRLCVAQSQIVIEDILGVLTGSD